jgi:hypothetical protein
LLYPLPVVKELDAFSRAAKIPRFCSRAQRTSGIGAADRGEHRQAAGATDVATSLARRLRLTKLAHQDKLLSSNDKTQMRQPHHISADRGLAERPNRLIKQASLASEPN